MCAPEVYMVVYLNTRTLPLKMYMSPTIICIPVARDELKKKLTLL